jgi:hypothetical protein
MPWVPKHKYIATLPPHLAEQVNALLRGGHSCNHVARVIQDTWKYHTQLSFETMKKAVQRYADDLFPSNQMKDLIQIGAVDLVTKLATKIDVLDELYKLSHIQRKRLQKALDGETKLSFTSKKADEQMKLMHDLVVAVAKIQLETGILPRATKTGVVQSTAQNGEVVFRVTEEQARVIEALKRDDVEGEVYDTRNG